MKGTVGRLARVASLVVLAGVGTIALMHWAPGYFTDSREMDAQFGDAGRRAVQMEEQKDGSVADTVGTELRGWMRGDMGMSRQYGVPVGELVRERAAASAKLLGMSVGCGWLLALTLALLLSGRRTSAGEALIAAPAAVMLAVPVGAMATACLVSDFGGPLLVLASLVAVRDFKMLYRLLRRTWRAPHFLYARSQGMAAWRMARVHLLPGLGKEMLALMMTSLVVALSMLVPVEVIFDAPGLGQLAWSAAMNRDMPVLLAVTLLMAACVGLAGMLTDPAESNEVAQCA